MSQSFSVADLCDAAEESGTAVHVAAPILRSYGRVRRFCGTMETVLCRDDNTLVRAALSEPGEGRVLVVDNGGSMNCAMLGGNLAALGKQNGWAGVVVNGCVRDTAELGTELFGVLALARHPRRSKKGGKGGKRGKPVSFAGVEFVPGHFLYADPDGAAVSAGPLLK